MIQYIKNNQISLFTYPAKVYNKVLQIITINIRKKMQVIQLAGLVDQFAAINLNSNARPVGFLKNIDMNYTQNIDQLSQLNAIYIDRLKYFKSSNRFGQCQFTISDISNEVKKAKLIGIFKRIQKQRIRAFQSNFSQKYQFNKKLYRLQDQYQLQDQTGKIRLQFNLQTTLQTKHKFNPLQLPYGVVILCDGYYSVSKNKYVVKNIILPKLSQQQKLSIKPLKQKYILTVNEPSLDQLNRLKIYIQNSNTQELSQKIQQVIIIGGMNYKNIHQVRQFDKIIFKIGELVDTFIMQSTGDAQRHLFPLKPFNKCLLKKSIQRDNVGLVSNPQIFQSNHPGTKFQMLVSCGQNLLNLRANMSCEQNCEQKSDLQLMKEIIKYGHICPSSTFSLPIESYSFDPLIMKKIPHLMIHGKCSKFAEEEYQCGNMNVDIKVKLVALSQGDMALTSLHSKTLKTVQFFV